MIVTDAPRHVQARMDDGNGALIVRLQPALCATDEQFYEFCRLNDELRIERDAEGEVSVMSPAGWETAAKNAEITGQLQQWARADGTGRAADSSAGYLLPNGAIRSPDASWVSNARLAGLTAEQKSKLLPVCPDFVVELRSASDTPSSLQAKMSEYLACGAVLGWLLDPATRRVFVYRPEVDVEVLDAPTSVSGDPELRGFRLRLMETWAPA